VNSAIRPQPGPQTAFLSSAADIAIYGGAAGGGKSWGLLVEALRHIAKPHYAAVFFRRTTKQIETPGGLWEASERFYRVAGGSPIRHRLQWVFPSGSKIRFAHLEYEKNAQDWQGSEIPLILFDELTHFTERQFWLLVSRNRTTSGVRPYVRASCNPDADSWVARFISWWIDPDTGFAIPERAGKLRWFVRVGETLIWADDPAELACYTMMNDAGEVVPIPAKSVTFISAKLTDNRALMQADPAYMANLLSLPLVERERLLNGNWKIRPAAGLYFQRGWIEVIDVLPARLRLVRGWDLAATPPSPTNPDPDWTSGTLLGLTSDNEWIVADNRWLRGSPSAIEELISNTASQDPRGTTISLPQDPGQAGKVQAMAFTKRLAQYTVKTSPESRAVGSSSTLQNVSAKVSRFSPFSAQAEGGNVKILRGEWNSRFFDDLEAFPEALHDDTPDSVSRAYAELLGGKAPMRINPAALTRFSQPLPGRM
jgi:predicted phage terminase large subunit-like protein